MRRWMVAAALAALACSAVVASSASAATEGARQVGPIAGKQRISRHQVYSTNWSGYVAHNDTFQSATGSWEMPTADCSKVKGHKETVATFFVGLDGFDSGTVEQTGVDAICIGTSVTYVPWYEFYPDRAFFFFDNTVAAGDALTATVSQDGTDVTTTLHDADQSWAGGDITASIPVDGLAFNSADWIAESPAHALTNFGSVTFSGASATDTASNSGTISSGPWDPEEIIMIKGRRIIAQPSDLSTNGDSFSVQWLGS